MSVGKGLSSLIPPKEDKNLENEELENKKSIEINKYYILENNWELKNFEEKSFTPEKLQKNKNEEAIFQIEVDKIISNPYQPRKEFDEKKLLGLAESIKQVGILQPLVVSKIVKEKPDGAEVYYELIAGERRLKAAKMIGLERVPAIIKHPEKEGHRLEMALIENLQRSDLNPIEEAKAYARLQDEFGLTQREIATRVGKSREAVANSLRLLNLPEKMQEALVDGKITESQARMLLSLNPLEREKIFENLLTQKLSVRGMKSIINRNTQKTTPHPQLIFLQKKLEEKLNLPVKLQIANNNQRGKIIIEFYSIDDIKNLTDKFEEIN